MRASLRSEPVQPINLFSFLDIVFTATGVLMVIGVFFSLSPHIKNLTHEPAFSAETVARQAELRAAVTAWRTNQALEKRLRRFATTRRTTATATVLGGLTRKVEAEALLLDAVALAKENRPLKERIASLETAISRRLSTVAGAEKEWLQREQALIAAESQRRRLLVKVDASPSLKEVVLMVVTRDWIEVEWMQRPELRLRMAAPWTEAARGKLLARFNPAQQRFVLFFKPSGAIYFDSLRGALKRDGYEIGHEPVPEDYTVNLHEGVSFIEVIR